MKRKNTKKLIVGEKVEARHFGEGLEGSWHLGVVVAAKKSFRLVEYNDLLREDGTWKLTEWIHVSAFIDGRVSSHGMPKDYRGDIRPSPPPIIHEQKLCYGLCVDAFVDDAWWEGVIFDREEGSEQRLLFFPDLGDQQMVGFNQLRITRDWDEGTGEWHTRGYWVLLALLDKFDQEGLLPVSIRQIWYDVRINCGFKSKISQWTGGEKDLWDELVNEAVQENLSAANGQSPFALNFSAEADLAQRSRKRRKTNKETDDFAIVSPSDSAMFPIRLPHCLENVAVCKKHEEYLMASHLGSNLATLAPLGNLSLVGSNPQATKGSANGSIERRKRDNFHRQVYKADSPSISSATDVNLPNSLGNGALEPLLPLSLQPNSVTLETPRNFGLADNNLKVPVPTEYSCDKGIYSHTLECGLPNETVSSETQLGPTSGGHFSFACTGNSFEEREGGDEVLEDPVRVVSGISASCSGASSGLLAKELPLNCGQALVDFLCEWEKKKLAQPHSEARLKDSRSKAMTHLMATGWRVNSEVRNRRIYKSYVSRNGKCYYSFIKACIAWKEEGTTVPGTMDGNEGKHNCLLDKIDVDRSTNAHEEHQSIEANANCLREEYAASRAIRRIWEPMTKELLPGAKFSPQAISDYVFEFENRKSCQKGLDDGELKRGLDGSRRKEAGLKARMHLSAIGWTLGSLLDKGVVRNRYVSPRKKAYYSLYRACLSLKEGGTVECCINGHGGRVNHLNCERDAQTLVTLSLKPKSLSIEHLEEQYGSVLEMPTANEDSRNEGTWVEMSPFGSSTYMAELGGGLDSIVQELSLPETLQEQPHGKRNCSPLNNDKLDLRLSKRERMRKYEYVEPQHCPQAITDYILALSDRKLSHAKDGKMTRSKARGHLSAMGWKFYHISKQKKVELRYRSPEGKLAVSLLQACQVAEGIIKSAERPHSAIIPTESQGNTKRSDRQLRDLAISRPQRRGVRTDRKRRKYDIHPMASPLHRETDVCLHPHPHLIEKAKKDGVEAGGSSGTMQGLREAKQDRKEFAASCGRKQKHLLDRPKQKKGKVSRVLPKRCDIRRYPTRVLRSRRKAPLQNLSLAPGPHMARTILSWLIDNDVVLPRQRVYYLHRKNRCIMAEGRITREGIKCMCCNKVYSLSNFEAHVGSNYHCPAANIFLQDGRSLLQCQIQTLQDNMLMGSAGSLPHTRRKINYCQYKSDIICSVCHYGGTLVLCDYCPSSFHLSCIDLKDLPEGKWFCPSCRCGICGQSGFNDDTEQFTETTVLLCDQCEREFHVGCLKKRGLARLECCPQGDWFCSKKCTKIFAGLNKLLGRSNPTGVDGLSWTMVRSRKEEGSNLGTTDSETMTEWHSKLCVAVNVLHECFVPIIEPRTKRDLVTDVLFNKGSELNRLNFRGFYTMLLEKGDELVSVATVRIYGEKVAEMPLVGTRIQYRRQGMCRLLVNELEKMLSSLGIERLILPAVPQLIETWTTSFGFTKMTPPDRLNLLEFTFLDFQDTTMCQKILTKPMTKSRGKPDKLSDGIGKISEAMDCGGYSIISEVMQTVDPIRILACDDMQTFPLHSQEVAIGDSGHLANMANSSSRGCLGLDLALVEVTKHNEQSDITEGISLDVAAPMGSRDSIFIRNLDIGEGSLSRAFDERSDKRCSDDPFKYFYTRRRILVDKKQSAQPLSIL